MCGIHAVISRDGVPPLSDDVRRCLMNRGPDHLGQCEATSRTADGSSCSLAFTSTVLSLRGDHVTPQPFQDDSTNSVLCWNGEAWRLDRQSVDGNDGQAIFNDLLKASRADRPRDAVVDVLRSIEGPFAFIYFDALSRKLFYGRDRLGRRSLLASHERGLVLSSVAETASPSWSEVEADGIYMLDLESWSGLDPAHSSQRLPWVSEEDVHDDLVLNIGRLNMTCPIEAPPPLLSASTSVQMLRRELTDSLKLRVLNVPSPNVESSQDTRVAVLFSGGLDCTVLARLMSDLLLPDQGIDLLNVAFENPRVAQHRSKDAIGSIFEACPDRITGRQSFAELLNVCPSRRWRFVAIDVPYKETLAHRNQVVSLMYPHNTEMDLSIAYALYFAARGLGSAQTQPAGDSRPYATTARVLLSGLGADELFGGYSRHQAAFERAGYPGLASELKLDVGRLGKRNLGRDDRVMAHWSREVRFPYLDERLVKWAVETPVWEKCDFDHPASNTLVDPSKRVLRLLAEELGLPSVAREKKRAVRCLNPYPRTCPLLLPRHPFAV